MSRTTQGLKWSLAVTGALALTLSTLPAHADERTSDTVDSIGTVAPEVFTDVATVATDEGATNIVDATVGEVDVMVASNPADGMSITADGETIGVTLPNAEEATEGTVEDSGIVTYDNQDGSTSTALVKEDGSLQVVTTITSAEAPSTYAYDFALPEGARAEVVEGGSVFFYGADGSFIGGIAPAWAKDANGTDIPTRYVIDGTTVTQEVDHTAGNFAYPVVADPWLGAMLWSRITVDTYSNQPRVNLYPSSWGRLVYAGQASGVAGAVAGHSIFNSSGWDEAWNWPSGRTKGLTNAKLRSALNKPSMRDQFSCHALGGWADLGGGGIWNLEKFRVNRVQHWSSGVATHRCNWSSATR